MDQTFSALVSAPLQSVQATLLDLRSYEHWLDLVDEVEEAEVAEGDPGPAYYVTLIARLGPFARRKRLRMVRSQAGSEGATFERREVDGRHHAEWVLGARAAGEPPAVFMRLAYGGSLWTSALENVLEAQVSGAVEALATYAMAHHGLDAAPPQ